MRFLEGVRGLERRECNLVNRVPEAGADAVMPQDVKKLTTFFK